jgi:hypothetical protein
LVITTIITKIISFFLKLKENAVVHFPDAPRGFIQKTIQDRGRRDWTGPGWGGRIPSWGADRSKTLAKSTNYRCDFSRCRIKVWRLAIAKIHLGKGSPDGHRTWP